MHLTRPPSTHSRRGVRRRRWPLVLSVTLAGLLASSLLLPSADAAGKKPFYRAETVTAGSTSALATTAARASLSSSVKVGVYPDASTWSGNGITNLYLNPDKNGTKFPVKNAEALLAKGVSLDVTLHPKGTNYIAGIVAGSADAMAWINAYIANIKTISDYAASLNNGTYVVAALMHESQVQVRDGRVTGASANYTTIGKAQEITIKLGKAAAPNAYWSVWIVGYDRTDEGTQLAQITNPKPDLISWDPYSARNCSDTFQNIAGDDLAWIKAQPAYNGNLGLSETAIEDTCSDAQMATYYTNMAGKLKAWDPAMRFATVFNRDGGYAPFLIQSSKTQAIAALKASLTR